jgi:hypothetical protein
VGRDMVVKIPTRYRLDRPGNQIPVGARFFAPTQTDYGSHPASYKMGTGPFLRVKWPGCGVDHSTQHLSPRLSLSLLMYYIYRAPCKARNFNVVYIWIYDWQRWKPPLSICCTMFQQWINTECYPVAQLCVNTLQATKVTLITDGI